MGLIKNQGRYVPDTAISLDDFLIGSDADNNKITKSYKVSDLLAFIGTQVEGTTIDNLIQVIDLGIIEEADGIASTINALPQFDVSDAVIIIYTAEVEPTSGEDNRIKNFVPVLNGKGTYGSGGTVLTDADLYELNPLQAETVRNTTAINNILTADRVLSGFIGYTGTGLVYESTDYVYTIGGVIYNAPADPAITLEVGEVNPRIDVIVGDTTGDVVVIKGTASASPAKPTLTDYDNQIELSNINVAALATELENNTEESIYNENLGEPTEWTITENTGGLRVSTASTLDPFSGTKSIFLSNALATDEVLLTDDAPFDIIGYDYLSMKVKVAVTGSSKLEYSVTPQLGGTQVAPSVRVRTGTYGFDNTNNASYQTIIIPIADFTTSSTSMDNFKIVFTAGTSAQVHLDVIKLTQDTGVIVIPPASGLEDVINVNPIATSVPQFHSGITSDVTGDTWFKLFPDFFSIGDFGEDYNGDWFKTFSLFDPDDEPLGMNFYTSAGGTNSSSVVINQEGFDIVNETPTNLGGVECDLGVLLLRQRTAGLQSIVNFETPIVTNHVYKIPANPAVAATNYFATHVNGVAVGSDGNVAVASTVFEGLFETGTRATGLTVSLGDYDDSNGGVKFIIDDVAGDIRAIGGTFKPDAVYVETGASYLDIGASYTEFYMESGSDNIGALFNPTSVEFTSNTTGLGSFITIEPDNIAIGRSTTGIIRTTLGFGAPVADNVAITINTPSTASNTEVFYLPLTVNGIKADAEGEVTVSVTNTQQMTVFLQSDTTTSLTVGSDKACFRIPFDLTLIDVKLSFFDAGTVSGSAINIRKDGVQILGTLLGTAPTEESSTDPGGTGTITTSLLEEDSKITIDVVAVPTGATGATVTFIYTPN